MRAKAIASRDEAECEALGAFLADRIYEFNAKATGCTSSTEGKGSELL